MKEAPFLSYLCFLVVISGLLSGCFIVSASPDPGMEILMEPGETKIFQVTGPPETAHMKYVWRTPGCDCYMHDKKTLEVKLADRGNPNLIKVQCRVEKYEYTGWTCNNPVLAICHPTGHWNVVENIEWEIRTSQEPPIWDGDYIIETALEIEELNGFTTIQGSLTIDGDPQSELETLDGLEGLTEVDGSLVITGNNHLKNLSGLEELDAFDKLVSIPGNLRLMDNVELTTLLGLNNITSIGGYLAIKHNDAMTSIDLSALQAVALSCSIEWNKELCQYKVETLIDQVSIDGNIWTDYNKECPIP